MPSPGDLQTVQVPTPVKTGNYTASPGDYVRTDTTNGPLTVTLPYSPPAGSTVTVEQEIVGTGNQTAIACAGSDVLGRAGSAVTSLALALAGQAVTVTYRGGVWSVAAENLPLAQLDSRFASAASVQPATTGTAGIVQYDGNAGDMQPLGTAAPGSLGLAADAGHTHPSTGVLLTGTAAGGDLTGTYPNPTVKSLSSLSGPIGIGSGGTGSATKNFVDLTTNQSIGGTKTFTGEVVVPTPVNASDACTKAYADAISAGLAVKPSAAWATAAALPAYGYASGVITKSSNGALSVDGGSPAVNDRVLVKNETAGNAPFNGIYVVTATGSGSAPFVLTRASDMNTGTQVPGAFCFVAGGSTNTNTGWAVTGAGPYTIGTTAITFTQFSGPGTLTAGTGITLSGNVVSLTAPVTVALGGTGATTAAGAITNLGAVDTTSAQTVAAKTLTGTSETVQALGTLTAGTTTVSLTSGNVVSATLGGNVTFAFTGATNGVSAAVTLWLQQDVTGGRTVTWPGSVTWLDGQPPAIATQAGAVSVIVLVTLNGGTNWYGVGVTGAPVIDTSAGDIAPTAVAAAAGSTGKVADAGHVHTCALIGGYPVTGTPAVNNSIVCTQTSPSVQFGYTTPAAGVVLDTTATDILPAGQQAAGGTGKASDAGHIHPGTGGWTALNHGLQAWAYPLEAIQTTVTLTSGTIYLIGLQLGSPASITALWWALSTAGAAGGSGGTFTAKSGLYNTSGSLIGSQQDVTTRMTSTTDQAATVAAISAPAGLVWLPLLCFVTGSGTTMPALYHGFNVRASLANLNLSASQTRFGQYAVSAPYTSLPSTIAPSSITPITSQIWGGVG